MHSNIIHRVYSDIKLNEIKHLGSVYKDLIPNKPTKYKNFRLMVGFRDLGGGKYKRSYIAVKRDTIIGSFSKLNGLKQNIDLF